MLSRALVAGFVGCALVAESAQAAALPTYNAVGVDSPQPQANEAYGQGMRVVGDVNGDGVNDVAFRGTVDVGGVPKVGRVWVLDGRTRAVLLTIDDPVPQANARFGSGIAGIGDVNGDGIPDLAIGASNQTVAGNAGQGKVWVFSGKDGHVLYSVDDPTPQVNAKFQVGTDTGDLNGDGVRDFVATASGENQGAVPGAGAAYAISGKTGQVLYKIVNPGGQGAPFGNFGQGISDPGDVTGDGVDDFVIGAPENAVGSATNVGTAYQFDGKTGAPIRTFNSPNPQQNAFFGSMQGTRGAPGDVDGDGVPDVLITADSESPAGMTAVGRGYIFSGSTGLLIRPVDSPMPESKGYFAYDYALAGDLNGDGTNDLLISQTGGPPAFGGGQGGAWVLDGRTGNVLVSFNRPMDQGGGSGLASPGDVNGDGVPDYFLSAVFLAVGANTGQGRVIAELSNPPAPGPGPGPPPPPGPGAGNTPPPGSPTGHPPVGLPRANLPGLRLSARRVVRGGRTLFLVHGSLRLPPSILGSQRSRVCHGSITVAARRGHKTGASRTVGLRKDCSFSLRIVVSTRKLGSKGRYNIRARFHGNANLNARSQATNIR